MPLIGALPALAVLCARFVQLRPAFIDDAYIFYRYATNWAHGLGLVFNRGELVEGFSSFLWTAVLAGAGWIGISPTTAGPALGLACAMVTIIVLAYVANELFRSRVLTVVVPLALALCYGFAFYAGSGMDTALFGLALLACVTLVARHLQSVEQGTATGSSLALAAATLVALVLVRAEGAVYALAIGVAAVVLTRRRDRAIIALPVVALAATGVTLLVRQAVYGAWVPATVSAKAYLSALVAHGKLHAIATALRDGLHYEGLVVLAVVAGISATLIVALWRRWQLHPVVWLAALGVAVNVGITVLGTGDWMPFKRLLVPALPLVLLLAAWSARLACAAVGATHTNGGWAATAAAAIGCALVVFGVEFHLRPFPFVWGQAAFTGIGRIIRTSDPSARVLTDDNGALSYYAGPRAYIWDMFGLTDAHNARHGYVYSPTLGRTDPAYDFTRNFDLMVANEPGNWLLMLEAFRRSPALLRKYVLIRNRALTSQEILVVVKRGTSLERSLAAYFRCTPAPIAPTVPQLVRGFTIPMDLVETP